MADKKFEQFLDKCYSKLEDKQRKLFKIYDIGKYKSYWYDQEQRVLQFKDDEKVLLEFSVIFIGSWSPISNSWMWSWGNSSMTEMVKEDSSKIKELKNITGFDIFENLGFECDEIMAYELVAMAVEHLDAIGMYVSPGERSKLFMALIKKI